jgi:hypothetical protein
MQVLKLSSRIDQDGHLRLDVPTQLPEGEIELVMVINPVQEMPEVRKYDFSDLAGRLTWRGDAVATQRSLRDEW